ncbi:MAG: indole-3-glycerol phosphate synthase TrpC [Ignavibacteriaceae bacterium]|nr:indole-3-glycerol phosphate synthase TrpC [Ignavibacteriaceae bacterium]
MNILDEIVEVKKEEIKSLRMRFNRADFESSEFFYTPLKSFIDKLGISKNISVISEVKKASPSNGVIREDFNHLNIANDYFNGGADAVSVLTDKNFFMGSINFLKEIAAIKTAPLLRKDFIIDEYQVLEAKANGADLILLICEILDASQIKDLTIAAQETGLEVLLELHSKNQIDKIDFSVNKLIGINNRDLTSFKVDLSSTKEIKKCLPDDLFVVSESGIQSKDDIDYLRELNINAVLVGEHLMKSKNRKASLIELKKWCSYES